MTTDTITLTRGQPADLDDAPWVIDSEYVTTFWLPVLGPTATWLLLKLHQALLDHAGEDRPYGQSVPPLTVSVPDLAGQIGVSNHSPDLYRALSTWLRRLDGYDVLTWDRDDRTVVVPCRLPTIPHKHRKRLTASLQARHDFWMEHLSEAVRRCG